MGRNQILRIIAGIMFTTDHISQGLAQLSMADHSRFHAIPGSTFALPSAHLPAMKVFFGITFATISVAWCALGRRDLGLHMAGDHCTIMELVGCQSI